MEVKTKLVEIQIVTFAYEQRQILKNINLVVPRDKVVAIMGGSGCGRTTILRLIGGQLRPSAGTVRVDGEAVDSLNNQQLLRLRCKMGMLFQRGALFTYLDVFENIAFQMREHTDLLEEMIHDLVRGAPSARG